MMKRIGYAVLFFAGCSTLMAASVPEIDATTGSSAIALITGAFLVVRGRRAK
jgi:hypothetical protein